MSRKAKAVLALLSLTVFLGGGVALYIYNLSECMSEFSTLYCVTQVKF